MLQMPRSLRLHVAGGFYHVTLRGNHRQAIFFRDADRELLNRIVAESLACLQARLHAYCWMTNHMHMLIQVSDVPLGKLILRIASKYARTVQVRLETTGHLFEKRYHAVLVDADSYLLTLIRYIHQNPVRGGLVNAAHQYAWSSHDVYLGQRDEPWVTTQFALRIFATDPGEARQAYRSFMDEPDDSHWGEGKLQPRQDNAQILGDDAFAVKVAGCTWRPRSRKDLEGLLDECGRLFHVSTEALRSPSRDRRLSAARAWLSQSAIAERIASVSEVARRLGRSEAAIRRLIGRHFHEPTQ